MSLSVDVLDRGDRDAYLAGLETAWPDWGGADRWQWVYERRCGGPPADLLGIEEAGALIAGSAVTYRRLRLASTSNEVLVGVMTGSWTVPAARGRGAFGLMVRASQRTVTGRGGALLLAFVTAANPSARRLASEGAAMWPSAYLIGDGTGPVGEEAAAPPEVGTIDELRDRSWGRCTRVAYTAEEFADQFLGRPESTSPAVVAGAPAVLERVPGFLRVSALAAPDGALVDVYGAVRALAGSEGSQAFAYTTDERAAARAEVAGMRRMPGSLALIGCHPDRLREAFAAPAAWTGDNRALLDPASPWYVGPVRMDSGDRV